MGKDTPDVPDYAQEPVTTCYTVGWFYGATFHLVFAQQVDELVKITASDGKYTLWEAGKPTYNKQRVPYDCCTSASGTDIYPTLPPCQPGFYPSTCYRWETTITTPGVVTSNTTLSINKPDLFGGTDRSGGIVGNFDVMFGRSGQSINPVLAANQSKPTAYRGVFSILARCSLIAYNSVTPEPIAADIARYDVGWEQPLQRIGQDMNPAHIIYDLLTSKYNGIGLDIAPDEIIDIDSFLSAASTLYGEEFGLSVTWETGTSIDTLINNILSHIYALIYRDPTNGKIGLKLLRNDYNPANITNVLTTSNILSIERLSVKSTNNSVNSVTLNYTNPESFKGESITAANAGAFRRASYERKNVSKDFFGIHNRSLASKVASRELLLETSPLLGGQLVVNRTLFDVVPGDVALLVLPEYNINGIVVRIMNVEYGDYKEDVIRVEFVSDIFSFGDTYITPNPDPPDPPTPFDPTEITEFTVKPAYLFDLVARFGGNVDTTLPPDISTYQVIVANHPGQLNWTLYDKKDNFAVSFSPVGQAMFSRKYYLAEPLKQEIYSTVKLTSPLDETLIFDGIIQEGCTAYIGEELVVITQFTADYSEFIVHRGLHDTVPQSHPQGETFQFVSKAHSAVAPRERVAGDTVEFKLQSRSFTGIYPIDLCPVETTTIVKRPGLPYAPGNFQVNGESYPEEINFSMFNKIDVTWSHRNRLLQLTHVYPQSFGDITLESDASYKVYIDGILELQTTENKCTIINTGETTYTEVEKLSETPALPDSVTDQLTIEVSPSIVVRVIVENQGTADTNTKDFQIYGNTANSISTATLLGDGTVPQGGSVTVDFANNIDYSYYFIKPISNYGGTETTIDKVILATQGTVSGDTIELTNIPSPITIEIETVKNGESSWQKQQLTATTI